MTTNDRNHQIRRALTPAEIDALLADLAAATSTGELADRAVRGVFTALLADRGQTLDSFSPQHQLRPGDYAIPTAQWQAIMTAVTDRAAEWGTAATLALDLVTLLPSCYDDPAVTAPVLTRADRRPLLHDLQVSREAVDVIAACDTHIQALAAHYGPASPQHLDALTSWHRQLAGLFGLGLGAHTRVGVDGPRSLYVNTASGVEFAIVFHGQRRRCVADGCTAMIGDDGAAHPPYRDAPVPDHDHVPSYPLGAPQPGTWTSHS